MSDRPKFSVCGSTTPDTSFEEDIRPVRPGEGIIPSAEVIGALGRAGFDKAREGSRR